MTEVRGKASAGRTFELDGSPPHDSDSSTRLQAPPTGPKTLQNATFLKDPRSMPRGMPRVMPKDEFTTVIGEFPSAAQDTRSNALEFTDAIGKLDCPECGSKRLFRAGFRYLFGGVASRNP